MSYMYLIILKKTRHAYKSKYNKEFENQITLLMITDGEKWNYRAVKKLSALLRGIISKHNGGFYCLDCFHSYSTINLKSIIMHVKIMIIIMQKCPKKKIKY